MGEQAKTEAKGQGRAVILPNGKRRIDYIRDEYYGGKDGAPSGKKRGEIKTAINEMLEKAGRKDEQIQYQIVFAASKLEVDPRIAAKAAAKVKADKKAEKEAAEAKEKKEKADKEAAAKK